MTLGERIIKLRQDNSISQKELADAIDKKTADVAMWESDEAIPSIIDINKLCSIFNVTSDELINDVDLSEPVIQNDNSNLKGDSEKNNQTNNETIKNKSSKKTILVGLVFAIIILCVAVCVIFTDPYNYQLDVDAYGFE